MRDDDAADIEADAAEGVNQPECILVIGDAQIAAAFGSLNIIRGECNHNLRLLSHLEKHFDLAVRFKAGKHPGCVVVVEQFAAELKIELAAELRDALANSLGLKLYILAVVKTGFCHENPPFPFHEKGNYKHILYHSGAIQTRRKTGFFYSQVYVIINSVLYPLTGG